MEIITAAIQLQTEGNTNIINITDEIQQVIREYEFMEGHVLVSAMGSTTGISTLEFEPGLVYTDVAEMFDLFAPYSKMYAHNKTWGDNNGSSHLRSFMTGTSQSFPFKEQNLLLGTWQQVVFVDFDTRPREREVIIQIMGFKV